MSHWYEEGPQRDDINEVWDEFKNIFNGDYNKKDDSEFSTSCFFTTENGVFRVLNDG